MTENIALGSEDTLLEVAANAERLNEAAGHSHAPWYRQAPLIIATMAILVSASSTWIAVQRNHEETSAGRVEQLTTMVTQLNQLPAQIDQAYALQGLEPSQKQALVSSLQIAELAGAETADDLIHHLRGRVQPEQYYTVALIYYQNNLFDDALRMDQEGVKASHDPVTQAIGYRYIGNLYFLARDRALGEHYYSKALHVYDHVQTILPFLATLNSAFTNLLLAQQEVAAGDCSSGRQALAIAKPLVKLITPTSQAYMTDTALIGTVEASLHNCS